MRSSAGKITDSEVSPRLAALARAPAFLAGGVQIHSPRPFLFFNLLQHSQLQINVAAA
jgi:hypothetical protein